MKSCLNILPSIYMTTTATSSSTTTTTTTSTSEKQPEVRCRPSPRNPGSSLVRRARLIRRQTTCLYPSPDGDSHKSSQNNQVVVSNVIVVKLKRTSEASPTELAELNGIKSEYVPYIDFIAPPLDEATGAIPAPLFFPDFTKPWTSSTEKHFDFFSVVLTNQHGARTFAYCRKFRQKRTDSKSSNDAAKIMDIRKRIAGERTNADNFLDSSVLVLTSQYPTEAVLKCLTNDCVQRLKTRPADFKVMVNDLLSLRVTDSSEMISQSKYLLNTSTEAEKWFRPTNAKILEKIGVESTVLIFLSLLAEKRIIVTGGNVPEITQTVQMFVKLLTPLEWPHTLIPIIPDTHNDLVYNPTPYICGMMRYNLNVLRDVICTLPGSLAVTEEITIVDVDRGVVVPCLAMERLSKDLRIKAVINAGRAMGFSKIMVTELIASLRSIFPYSKIEKANAKIEQKIMIWYAQFFGHYKNFPSNINVLSSRNKRRFIKAHPIPDTRESLSWFVESGIFQTFIYSARDNNAAIKRFYKILEKYAPPVHGHSTQSKARRFMWRLFHK